MYQAKLSYACQSVPMCAKACPVNGSASPGALISRCNLVMMRFFQPRYVRLRNPQLVGHLLLRHFPPVPKAEAHFHQLLFSRRQLGHRPVKQLAVDLVLEAGDRRDRFRWPRMSESSSSLPSQSTFSGSSRLTSLLSFDVRPQIHENLVLYAARSVSGQLDVLIHFEGVDRLDEADGADRDQILNR